MGGHRRRFRVRRRARSNKTRWPALSLWRVLVDNLGMAYGITGDLNKAEATFRYGLSKDATYPMFFYNIACVYGERNDLENALLYLNKAHTFRANSIPGEGLPDPPQRRFL
jgi:tetratricopeptide (TPR) repeat protein